MLDNHVLPIVNENDTVAVSELMFTDNDELAGLVATMLNADALILLTNVDGVLDSGTQTTLPNVIPIITQTTNLNHVLSTGTSAFGRGGMLTKCNIARKVALHGVKVFIANGNKQFIINDILYNNATCTQFVTANKHVSSVKKWIANAGDLANGEVHIDQGAEDALYKNTASSILTIGVTKLTGHFKKGDIVSIVNPKQQIIGLGRIELDANKAIPLIRKHHKKPLIHYNYLYLHNNITL
jgi:glutamate 5-kinase